MYLSHILKRDNNNIDLLRLLAALLVVWYHGPALFQNQDAALSQRAIVPSLVPVTVDSGYVGVAVFFFLSGLLVTNSLISKGRVAPFVWARFMRIMPGFLVTVLLAVFVIGPAFTTLPLEAYFRSGQTWRFLFRNAFLNIEYDLPGVWNDRVYGGFNGSAWSIPFEVGCYIFLLLSYILCNRWKVSRWIFYVMAFALAFIPEGLLPLFTGNEYSVLVQGDIFCFTVGSLMAVYKDRVRIDKSVVFVLLLACVLLWRSTKIIYYLFPLSTAIIFLYATSLKPLVGLRPKHDISYGVYLWHWPVMEILYTWMPNVNFFVFWGTAVAVVVIIAYASARLVEEPCQRWGRELSNRNISFPDNGVFIIIAFVVAAVIAKVCY